MNCNDYLPLICGYLDGENGETETKQLQAHLEGCEECRKLLEQMQENDRLLADVPEAPADLSWRIMQQVRKEPKKQNRWKRWGAVLSAAAVLAVVLLSGTFLPDRSAETANEMTAEAEAETGVLYRSVTEACTAAAEVATEGCPVECADMSFCAAYLLTEEVAELQDMDPMESEDARALLTEDVLALLDAMELQDLQAYCVSDSVMEELKANSAVVLLSENAEAECYIVFYAKTP